MTKANQNSGATEAAIQEPQRSIDERVPLAAASPPFYHCERTEPHPDFCAEDVHGWFDLTYANYLTIPRSLLQEMPAEWQHRFVRLLDEIDAVFTCPLEGGHYKVLTQDRRGKFTGDPLRNYRYPDRWAIEKARTKAEWDTDELRDLLQAD